MNFKKYVIMMFTSIYKLALLISQTETYKQQLPNTKNIDAVKKIIYQNKTLLKIDSIVIRADEMLLITAKIGPDGRKRDEKKEASRRKNLIKNLISFITNIMIK